MDWAQVLQTAFVVLIVGAAALFAALRAVRSLRRRKSSACACSGGEGEPCCREKSQ